MTQPSLPWVAMLHVMNDLLVNAYNVLVKWMNEHKCNNSDTAEYWICELLQRLSWPSEDEFRYRRGARADYVQTCIDVCEFAYRRAGRVFDIVDVRYEIRICWERELDQLFWIYSPDDDEWDEFWAWTYRPENWSVPHVSGRKAHMWNKATGVLLYHCRSYEDMAKAERIEQTGHRLRRCAILRAFSGVLKKLNAVRWRRNAD